MVYLDQILHAKITYLFYQCSATGIQNGDEAVPRIILVGQELLGPPGVLGICGEWLFIFRELGSNGNYLRGAMEKAHNLGDLGSLAKKQKQNKN